MDKLLYAIAGIAAFIGLDRLLGHIYKTGFRNGHKHGHKCMLDTMRKSEMRKSEVFREAAESMPPPMHTEN